MDVRFTNITDTGIRSLRALTKLSVGTDTVISDAGISTLTNLRTLEISNYALMLLNPNPNTTITDFGIRSLSSSLTALRIHDCNLITDDSIKYLTKLKTLWVYDGVLSTRGVRDLSSLTELCVRGGTDITKNISDHLPDLKIVILMRE